MNEVACHKCGYTREEFLALTIRDIRPSEDIPRVDASVRTTASQIFNSGVWRHRKKDGTIIHVEILSHEILFKGRRTRFVCPMDATERTRAEEARARLESALQERGEGLRHAQRMAKLAHVITGQDGSFESWSETLPQLIGVDAAHSLKARAHGSTSCTRMTAQRFVQKRSKLASRARAPTWHIGCGEPTAHGSMCGKGSSRSRGIPIRTAGRDGSAHCRT